MKTIEWAIVAGVVIIGLYATGIIHKLIPSLAIPSKNLSPSDRQQYNKMSNIQQVAYQPPNNNTRRACIRGICTDIPTFNQTYV
jgi:hypothetical protein